jgi:hypothetical protein
MHPAAVADPAWLKLSEATMPVEAVAPAIVWLASDSCSETNRIYNVEAGVIQRIAIVMGPGFYDPHLTPESIAENYAKVESIEGRVSERMCKQVSVSLPYRGDSHDCDDANT